MAYSPTTWSNGNPPAISETNLNNIEAGIVAALGGAVNVQDYGAVGDGSTDDTTAINAAITAAGTGGTVIFPPHAWGGGASGASYVVSSTLKPRRAQRWIGAHTPQYDSDEYFLSSCVIRAASTFTGSSLIAWDSSLNNNDVVIQNLGLQGRGESHGTSMYGIHGGTTSSSTERNWLVRDCNISAFSTAGIGGHWLAAEFDNVFVMRCDYGVNPGASSAALRDVNMHHCKIAWNISGGVYLNGTSASGGNTFLNCRFERNGVTPGTSATVNRNYNAPGVRYGSVHDTIMVGCYTDGNSGPGLHVEDGGSYPQINYGNTFVGNCFIRDGGGDLSTTSLPGVLLDTTSQQHLYGNIIEDGDPSDGGGAGTWPVYGLWIEACTKSTIEGGRIEMTNDADSVYVVGTANSQTRVELQQFGYTGLLRKQASVSGSRNLAMTDFGRRLEVSGAYTITIPQTDSANWAPPDGWWCTIYANTASDVTIAAGSGATLRSLSSYTKLAGQYAMARLEYRGSDVWVLSGDLKA